MALIMFYLFNSEALSTVLEHDYGVLLFNYRRFRKRSLYGDLMLEFPPCDNITGIRILLSMGKQIGYLRA